MKTRNIHLIYGSILGLSVGLNIFALSGRKSDAPSESGNDPAIESASIQFRTMAVDQGMEAVSVNGSHEKTADTTAELVELKSRLASIRRRHQDRASEAYLRTAEEHAPDTDILLAGGTHGIVPERVIIGKVPDSAQALEAFLPGSIWSWASNNSEKAGDLGEYVVFLGDGTMFGSWGLRYRYSVTEDLTIDWWKHQIFFGEDFQGFRSDGKLPRVGRLLQKIEGAELEAVRAAASQVYVVLPDDELGQPELMPDQLEQ